MSQEKILNLISFGSNKAGRGQSMGVSALGDAIRVDKKNIMDYVAVSLCLQYQAVVSIVLLLPHHFFYILRVH